MQKNNVDDTFSERCYAKDYEAVKLVNQPSF